MFELKTAGVLALILLALCFPHVGYVIAPFYQQPWRREVATRLELDHHYFGVL